MRKIIRPISIKRAYRRRLIDNYDFCKCFVCGSSDLTQDNNQTVYHEEIHELLPQLSMELFVRSVMLTKDMYLMVL